MVDRDNFVIDCFNNLINQTLKNIDYYFRVIYHRWLLLFLIYCLFHNLINLSSTTRGYDTYKEDERWHRRQIADIY